MKTFGSLRQNLYFCSNHKGYTKMEQKGIKAQFIERMRQMLGVQEAAEFAMAMRRPAAVAVRMNPCKPYTPCWLDGMQTQHVPWCLEGIYLPDRPVFPLDPGWSAGAYYVQDPSSMFYTHILRHIITGTKPLRYLDVCAAPGGKTTAALSVLPEGSLLVANEYIPARAAILNENLRKWGAAEAIVTSCGPDKLRHLKASFDIIAVDAPCSGEGMMRKEEVAVSQWSPALIEQCALLQHEIVQSIWHLLRPGGILIYSTCTFNRTENEEMVNHICEEFGAESVNIPIDAAWGIRPGIDTPCHCYRFMPHHLEGEGLFVSVLRKDDDSVCDEMKPLKNVPAQFNCLKKPPVQLAARYLGKEQSRIFFANGDNLHAVLPAEAEMIACLQKAGIQVISPSSRLAVLKGKDYAPHTEAALSRWFASHFRENDIVSLDLQQARAYLRRETVQLPPDTPRGYICAEYEVLPLGMLKNIGNRANNLWPHPWQIRISH